jgi:energy-converting hydrogenase Eha subunit H
MSVPQSHRQVPVVSRRIEPMPVENRHDEDKIRRTLAAICGFSVNTYMMYLFKASEGVSAESQLFFHLLALVMLVVTIKERDASYLFSALDRKSVE